MDINVTGEVKNANTSVVYSKYGDITIENDSTANINGLIYCPLGTLTIDSPNINLNGVIIADKIVINGGSVNINYKENMAGFIGTESEKYDFSDLEYLPESWLGDTKFDNLIILWYNEEEQIFEEMPTTRNWENSTVSTTTTHFSQYLIVDCEKWYTNWEASFSELRRMWDNGTTSYKPMNTIFVIDCCADMGEHDKDDQRLNICSNIVDGMMEDDRAAVITYSEYGARGITGLTDKYSALAILKSYIWDSGARSNLKLALKDALTIAHSSSSELNRIIILTNGNTQFTFELDDYDLNNVNVYIVDMGGYTIGESLKNLVNEAHGCLYSAVSASDLIYQVGETITTPPQFIGDDSDGDSIPDIVEDYGLKPNGQPIGTKLTLYRLAVII